ncbi:MAG: hypothetical protein ACOC1K_02930 [Nanoarchaeota archaeon]
MSLFHKYNNEDLIIRATIAGLLNVLNNEIKYNQVWDDDDIETINVPWYYNQSGDERFMQDFYTHYAHCLPPKPVDGNFDMIPRGVITYSGSGIDEQRITSRYVQGKYLKEVDGKLNSYVSYLYSLPLSVRFEAEMWIDREISAMKIEQEIREVLYKTKTYYVYYKGMRVGCTAGFPAEVGIQKNIQYSFESDNKIKLSFQVEVETYQPVFDPTIEMLAENRMKGFGYRLYSNGEKNDGNIRMTAPSDDIIIPKGIPIWLEWVYSNEGAVISNVDIYWLNNGTNDRNEIELHQPNKEFYIWNIPNDFTNYIDPTIIWEERGDPNPISVSRDPVIKIIPDTTTREITDNSFNIIEEGYFYTSSEDSSINLQLEIKDKNGNITYSDDGKIWADIKFNKLTDIHITQDFSLFYPDDVDYKLIDIHVANSVNNDVFGIVNRVKIV